MADYYFDKKTRDEVGITKNNEKERQENDGQKYRNIPSEDIKEYRPSTGEIPSEDIKEFRPNGDTPSETIKEVRQSYDDIGPEKGEKDINKK